MPKTFMELAAEWRKGINRDSQCAAADLEALIKEWTKVLSPENDSYGSEICYTIFGAIEE